MTTMESTDLWEKLSDKSTPAGQLFMDEYEALDDKLGNSLKQLEHQAHDIQGRDHEIELLHAILERPKTPVALLVGHAGVGKTALVEEFAKQLNSGTFKSHVHNKYVVIALRLGVLASLGTSQLQTRLATLLDDFKHLQDVAQTALGDESVQLILFMDEVHMLVTIFGAGTKVGGDVIKDVLARAPIRVIAATTRREYDSTLAVDKPLSERFKQIEMQELPEDIVVEIVNNWWSANAPDCEEVDDDLIRRIIDANAKYRSDSAEPRKSLDIMEDLVSYCRRTGKKADLSVVEDVFKRRYSISLSMAVDSRKVFENVERRVFGQPVVKYTLDRALLALKYPMEPTSGKPRLTMLFTGPTGVGKALHDDTLVPVADERGYARIADIRVGDKVFAPDGSPVGVTGVFPQGQCEAIKFHAGGNEAFIVNRDHLWGVTRDPEVSGGIEVLTTQDIMDAHDAGDTRLFRPRSAPVKRPHNDHIADAFALGYATTGVLGANRPSREHLAQTPAFKNLDDKTIDQLEYACGLWHLGINAPRVPDEIMNSSIEQRISFVQGLMSAYGRVVGSKKLISFETPSPTLARDIVSLLSTLGVHGAKMIKRKALLSCAVIISDARDIHAIDFFEKTDRKYASLDALRKSLDWSQSPGDSFDSIGSFAALPGDKVPMTCIKIDSDDGLFQMGRSHIVTHNTETAKAIEEAMYPGESVLLKINMPDYDSADHKPAFQKRVGEFVRHTPNAIILLDEIDKAKTEVLDALLAMTDEGEVTFQTMNREGNYETNTTSLRNTVLICTTNAGAEVFALDAKYSQREEGHDVYDNAAASEIDDLMTDLRQNLMEEAGFRPEFMGRFNHIMPFRSLTPDALLRIGEKQVAKAIEAFEANTGVEVVRNEKRQWDPDMYDHVTDDVSLFITFVKANANDSNSGGARAIAGHVMNSVYTELLVGSRDNPNATRLKIEVSKDAKIYNPGALATEGGVTVSAID